MSQSRKSYPPDVSDDEWALVVPYLTLLPENVGQQTLLPTTNPTTPMIAEIKRGLLRTFSPRLVPRNP